jgi:hypothetical protein
MPDMTYSDSAASIQSNVWFRGRVQVATSKYANYLLNTPTDNEEYESKTAYGTRITQAYMQIVDSLMFTLSGDAEVITAGPAISDSQLQSIVEKTIVRVFPPTPATPALAQFGAGPMPAHRTPPPPPATQ